jgi:predicted small lipoprotein YifL
MTPIRLIIVLAAAAVLAGCGVKGPPELAGDKADMYPRTYPPGAVPSESAPPGIFVERYPER